MGKMWYIFKEMLYLMKNERMYILFFIFLAMLMVAILVYQVTPVAVVTFIYAGV